MRGRIAAACAAMLVGLSPAGALPFARLAVAACASQESGALELAPTKIEPARELRARSFAARSHNDAPRAVVFRSPSGPAPSQAPPLA